MYEGGLNAIAVTKNEALKATKESKMDGEDALHAPAEANPSVPSTASSVHSPRPPATALVPPPSQKEACPPPLELGWTRLGKRPESSALSNLTTKTSRSDAAAAPSGFIKDTVAPTDGSGGGSLVEPHPIVASDNKGKGKGKGEEDDDDDDDDFWLWNETSSSCWSCTDPSCVRRREETNGNGVGFVFQRRRAGTGADGQQLPPVPQRFRAVRGRAAWLLPTAATSEVDWFQGYLIPQGGVNAKHSNNKPWGLLAQQVDIDECLACADGGYRRVSIALYDWNGTGPSQPPHQGRSQGHKRSQHTLGEADWTGGDMMKLLGTNVRMRPTQLLTGRAAVPYVTGLFSSLWKRIVADHQHASCDGKGDEENDPQIHQVLDLLPDVAIALGEMEVILSADPDESR